MRDAEEVTFGGSGLDRAAQLRGEVPALLAREGARVLPLWRGKPLMAPGGLATVPTGHEMLEDVLPPLFIGLDEGIPIFAADLAGWRPDVTAETVGAFLDPSEQVHPDAPPNAVFAELRARMTTLTPREAEIAATARALAEWHRTHGFCANCGERSEVAQAGWQRTCPDCGRHHFPRTDPVAIMLVTQGDDVLLGRSPGWPDGMFSLLAGFVEPGETLEAAVRREVFEETGVRIGEVGYLASQPWPFPASLMFGCHGHAISREITVDPEEIEAARWVSRQDMVDVMAGTHPEIRRPRPGAIAHFLVRRWLEDSLD